MRLTIQSTEPGHSAPPDRPRFGDDPKPFFLAFAILAVFEFVRRVFLGYVPADFTAYLHAADVFVDGLDPYTWDRKLSPRYDGFPYNYIPGTLFLITPLAFLPTPVALGVDWILRCICLVYSAKTLHRIVTPNVHFHWILGLLLLWEPLGVDLLFGNLVTYLFCAFVICVDVGDRLYRAERLSLRWYVALFVCGIVLSFKPFWGIPCGYALLAQRHWKGLGALGSGVAIVLGLTVLNWSFVDSLRTHTKAMVGYYQSIDFFNLAPWSLAPVSIVGLAIGVYFLKHGPQRWIWLLGALTIPMWPRTASYSYTIMFPVTLWLIRRWGLWKGLICSITIVGPIPWFFRTLPFLHGEQEELWLHFIWMLAIIPVVILSLRDAET